MIAPNSAEGNTEGKMSGRVKETYNEAPSLNVRDESNCEIDLLLLLLLLILLVNKSSSESAEGGVRN